MLAQMAWSGRPGEGWTGVAFLGRKGEKCFRRRSGPRVLILKVESAFVWEIWVGDFSG